MNLSISVMIADTVISIVVESLFLIQVIGTHSIPYNWSLFFIIIMKLDLKLYSHLGATRLPLRYRLVPVLISQILVPGTYSIPSVIDILFLLLVTGTASIPYRFSFFLILVTGT